MSCEECGDDGDDDGQGDDGAASPHGTLSAETLSLPGLGDEMECGQSEGEPTHPPPPPPASVNDSARPRPRSQQSRQSGLERFFGRIPSDSNRPLNPPSSTPSHSWEECYTPPRQMDLPAVDCLDEMMNWAQCYRTALHQTLPHGALCLLRERLENGSYSTCYSGVDAPGSVTRLLLYRDSRDSRGLDCRRATFGGHPFRQCFDLNMFN